MFGFAVEFLAYTGLRAAEFAGMDVGDVTIGRRRDRSYAGSIAVNRTRRKLGGEWITGTPKSKKSRRTILLDDWLAEKLHHYLTETHPRGEDPNAPLFPNRRNGGAPGPRALDWNAPGNWSGPGELAVQAAAGIHGRPSARVIRASKKLMPCLAAVAR